jgi:sulfate/thiosulfate transport system substrate-binding protein
MKKSLFKGIAVCLVLAVVAGCGAAKPPGRQAAAIKLLNVSYDPTRELYRELNDAFAAEWKRKTGGTVTVEMSHGGSGSQARAVIDGLAADVVTLALAFDIDAIAAKTTIVPKDWQSKLARNSSPYTSTIVFLVRKGNPKGIKDWNDLVKPGVEIITPNPKTSGGARWNYLAAWAYVLKQELGDLNKLKDPAARADVDRANAKARDFVARIFANVPVLDSGARGSTNTFVQRGLGDVLLAWENEAFLAINELGPGAFEIVVPSVSMLCEPPVAVVEGRAQEHGTLEAARAYLAYLYTPEGQRIAARHYYRPTDPKAADPKDMARFPELALVSIDAFGGWQEAQKTHFGDGGVFDTLKLRSH